VQFALNLQFWKMCITERERISHPKRLPVTTMLWEFEHEAPRRPPITSPERYQRSPDHRLKFRTSYGGASRDPVIFVIVFVPWCGGNNLEWVPSNIVLVIDHLFGIPSTPPRLRHDRDILTNTRGTGA